MVRGVPKPLRLKWRKGKPREVGLFLVQYKSGDLAIAEVRWDYYVEQPEQETEENKSDRYLALIIDDCSEELSSEVDQGRFILRHFGPLRKPPKHKPLRQHFID